LIITSKIKPEILGHVVQSFFRKYTNVHHIYRLFYEQDKENCILYENNCLLIETSKVSIGPEGVENEAEKVVGIS
jgi:hypothetical protein